jgi:CubicO group peptidase (beta-lactamase class C family)
VISALTLRADQALREHVFPGCVIGILRDGEEEFFCFGNYTYDLSSPEVTKESVYDLASITKSVPTATLALQLIGERRLSLDDKLIEYIPEYNAPHRNEVTVRHLLTYTLGNTLALSSLKYKTAREIFDAVCSEESEAPGMRFSYSNTPAYLLGVVVERVLGIPLDHAAERYIFKPLGMTSATFHPVGAVPTEVGIENIIHDESARIFAKEGKVVGHAGLFSNAPDLLIFMRHLLGGDTTLMATNQIANLEGSAALGWELNQPFMGSRRGEKTFGKTGFTGTSIVCDPERKTAIVILSNRTYPSRPHSRTAIDAFRSDVCDIVFS